jgi:hypothetical protein
MKKHHIAFVILLTLLAVGAGGYELMHSSHADATCGSPNC